MARPSGFASRHLRAAGLMGVALTALVSGLTGIALSQGLPPPPAPPGGPPGTGGTQFLFAVDATRIADPKLDGGGFKVQYRLQVASRPYDVKVSVVDASDHLVATVYQGKDKGAATPSARWWDGRQASGAYADPGSYTVRVAATDSRLFTQTIDYAIDVVRLGIRSIAAESSSGINEWQTVYFRKNGKYAFYATPATGEFLSGAESGDVSALDLNDGTPRPAPAIYTVTDTPLIELGPGGGAKYEDDSFNYPICYLAGAIPQFTAKFGATCTWSSGSSGGCNYPVSGYEIRLVARDQFGAWSGTTTSISPAGTATLTGPALTALHARTERDLHWSYEYRPVGATIWSTIPGHYDTAHRIYTILDKPYWSTTGSGTQYTGPWVEVLEYIAHWGDELGITCNSSDKVVETLIKGYFGQQGNLLTAIEGAEYDCPSQGGDGGATHYGGTGTVHLSHLLNNCADGIYVNCTDCATTTTVMLAMVGTKSMQLFHLGSMTLRAIWGIGCDDYTLDLWGGSHSFSYHHIITRDGGINISDACLCVDEDGSPDTLPGTPGYNHDRDWNNYEALLAHGNITTYTEKLPKVD